MDFTALKTAIQNAVKLNGNEEITGDILQGVLLSMVTTLGDSAINDLVTAISNEVTARQNADGTLQTNINNEATTRGNADTALQNAINAINTKLAEGCVYVGIATTSTNPSTPSGKVFYIAVTAGTYTNFLDSSSQPLVLTQGINILKYNGTEWSVEQIWGVDDEPTAGSNNLVKSGGVFNSIRKLEYVDVLQNLFDKENVILNNFYAGGNLVPTLSSNTNFGCQLVEIPNDSSKYIMNYKDYQVDAFNANKQLISEVYFSAGVAHTVPNGTKYLSISLQKAHIGSFMLIEGEVLPESYIGFGTNLKNGTYISKPKIYNVGIPMTSEDYYEYQNLTELLKSLKDDDSEKIIYIHGGTYDIFQEYGGADYIATLTGNENWRDVSVLVPNNTKIIGLGRVILNWNPTDAQIVSSQIAHLFSPLNVTGNTHIENIEINCHNGRYCIHDEVTEDISENTRHTYVNVRATKTQGLDGDPQAFGCGFGKGMVFNFKNCKFKSYTIAFSMHNDDTARNRQGSIINIESCEILGSATDTPISFRNSSTIQAEHIVNICNSYIKGSETDVYLQIMANSTTAVNCFNIKLLGCNVIKDKYTSLSTTNIYPITHYSEIGVPAIQYISGTVIGNKKLIFNNDNTVTWQSV